MPVIGSPVTGSPLAGVISVHSDQTELDGTVEAIGAALATAKRPFVLAAFKLGRYGLTQEAAALVDALGVPFAATSMDKGVLPESHPLYAGQYGAKHRRAMPGAWSKKPISSSTSPESSSTTPTPVSALA